MGFLSWEESKRTVGTYWEDSDADVEKERVSCLSAGALRLGSVRAVRHGGT